MKEWTFLLQKDGDRSWLPLDSPDVEILEGRYRIVVQTDRPNTDINIRICHLATDEDPPKRRIQKRANRTNNNGLMVVSPFTQLQPGNWELSCFLTDPLSDLMGDTLHHAVRLRVSDQQEEEIDPWDGPETPVDYTIEDAANHQGNSYPEAVASVTLDPNLATSAAPNAQDLAALNVEIAQALGFSMERLVEMTDQLSHQLVEEIFREFNVPIPVESEAIAPEPITLPSPEVIPAPVPAVSIDVQQLQIGLAQAGWLAARGEQLTISGHLTLAETAASDAPVAAIESAFTEPDLVGAVPQELQLQLRDPQTSKVLFHACQSFPVNPLPTPFHFLCQLPDELTTHLLLGEIIVAGTLPGAETVLVTLKTYNFSVTVDPQGLVAELQKVKTALAERSEQDDLPDLVAQLSDRLAQEKVGHGLDLSFLNMAAPVTESSQTAEMSVAKAISRKQILPPLLHLPDVEQSSQRKLELPAFVGAMGRTQPASQLESDVEVERPTEIETDSPNLMPTAVIQQDDSIASSISNPISNVETPPPSGLPPEVTETPRSSTDEAHLKRIDELSSPIRSAFQALNLQDKFLTRLSSIAADAELTTLLKLTLPQPALAEVDAEQVGVAVEPRPLPISEVIADLDTTEVVVDDDPSWREWVKRAGSRSKQSEVVVEPPATNPLMLPPDEPVPLPQLELGIDDIVAGRPINLRVKLPNLTPKIYVKLWVNDRQTRTLLDGPRWLVDFLPNGFDELEASTQLTAPFGSTDIRLEAIAVEIHTQRESQKVSLECEVIPAEVPDDLFDDFDY